MEPLRIIRMGDVNSKGVTFLEMLYEDVKNLIRLYIVVSFVVGIVEEKRRAILAPELKAVVHPAARDIEEVPENGRFVQGTGPAKLPLGSQASGNNALQRHVIGMLDIMPHILRQSGEPLVGAACAGDDRLQQILIPSYKQEITVGQGDVTEDLRSQVTP